MYIPRHFEVTDSKKAIAFIKENAFGQLISSVDGKLFSSHLPFIVEEDEQSLICHMAKQNPQWEALEKQEILITFQGDHDYVSPSWFNTPGVPTWNYQAVHIYGKPTIITDAKKLKNIVDGLTHSYESSMDESWQPEYNAAALNAIVGIEIKIDEIQCKCKLSQNRSKIDQIQIADELAKRGSIQLSKAMKINDK